MIEELFAQHAQLLGATQQQCAQQIEEAAQGLVQTLAAGHRVLLCGNGGSAADCQHMAAEIVGRFETARSGLAAQALNCDGSILTSLGNDFGFEAIFSRQVQALGGPGDLLWAYSTSGRSKNVLAAAEVAVAQGMQVLALTGSGPNPLSERAHLPICVPSTVTARIQEMHALIGHMLCASVDGAGLGLAPP